MADQDDLAARAVARMQKLGLSQADVARRGRFSRAFISDVVRRRKTALRSGNWLQLAKALGTTVDYLRHGIEPDDQQIAELIAEGWIPRAAGGLTSPDEADDDFPDTVASLRFKRRGLTGIPVLRSSGRLDGGALVDETGSSFFSGLDHLQTSNLYAVIVTDDVMTPRFAPGEAVYAQLDTAVLPRDYVVVQVRGRSGNRHVTLAYIRQLLRDGTEEVVVRQLSPSIETAFPRSSVLTIDRIVLSGELLGERPEISESFTLP